MKIVFLSLFLALVPLAALAQTLPDPITDTVSDYANLLPPEAEARLTETLTTGRADTGVHVVLVTMERIADYGGSGERMDAYAKRLFNHWGVGDATRNDGILILVARTDREVRIALGAGYEVIWDNAAQRVIDRHILPAFRNDDYVGGIEAGVAATFDLIARAYVAGNPPPKDPAPSWEEVLGMTVFGVIAAAIIGVIARSALGDVLARFKRCPNCSQRQLNTRRKTLSRATSAQPGEGIKHTRCKSCGWDRSETYTIPSTSSKSGSSGGFGGGSSSGGGASGRW